LTGYPTSAPKPAGPFRLLSGAEYAVARGAANSANDVLHNANPALDGLGRVHTQEDEDPAQRASVQGKPCVDCGAVTPKQVADHKTPLVKEHYETGTIDTTRMRSVDAVQPQCPTCSARQGADMSRYSREQQRLMEGD
jgi:hypothetical protein